ncbi:MAG: hypothetical protein COW02_11030 [Comamonadaceae bacterium CG12_big_fil_rev_8_21_14_0_65_59_15]|nr:MAG: hypothetical protein COW02_11030 [Comamonadaceae bacterium CG12_big_fil_rev_8_21_14_0_65_59_15]
MLFIMPWGAGILISIFVRTWWSLMDKTTRVYIPVQMNFFSPTPILIVTQWSLSMPNGKVRPVKLLYRNGSASIWLMQVGRTIKAVPLSLPRNWRTGCGRIALMCARLWVLTGHSPHFAPR